MEMPTVEPESQGETLAAWEKKLTAEKAAYAAKEAVITAARGFESLVMAITEIGPFESSGVTRVPEEIIAKIKSLESAASQKEVENILQTIPRKYRIRDTVMDIMGIEK